MYKILFVDDEINVLEYLPLAINWEELGITCMFEASDSENALDIVRRERPDIAIVDVEMPGKNGLEFCQEARQINPQMVFVILSAYDRFDYAKKAISVGVVDYLLKPVDERELLILMKKIISNLDETQKGNLENVNGQMFAIEKAIGNYVQKLFRNEKAIENLEIDFPMISDYKSIMIAMQGNEDLRECGDLLKESVDSDNLFIPAGNGIYAVLWKANGVVSVEKRVESIRRVMEKEGVRVWISGVYARDQENICQAITRCFYELEKLAFMTDELGMQENANDFRQIEIQLPNIQKGLEVLSEYRDTSMLHNEICCAVEDAFRRHGEPICICEMILEVFIALKMYLTKNWNQDAMKVFRGLDIIKLMRCGTRENLYSMIEQHLDELKHFLEHQHKLTGDIYIVRTAKEYTKQNYQKNDLSLQEVADAVGISRTYFSKVFKDMTGEKYWDYLSKCRIEKAKEFLCNTNLGQAEISEKVGYSSEFHFSRKFKELVGMSPNKFRKKV